MYADWNIIFGFPGEQPADYQRNLELVGLLTHLNPPSSVGTFRMDRFSANFEKSAQMGFKDVRPHHAYRYVYPLPDATLSKLVYFFDYRYQTEIDDEGYLPRISEEVSNWRARQDQLTCAPVGDSLMVYDTRAVAPAPQSFLRGIRRDVIEYCDKAHGILDDFLRDKLMVKEGSWYLSLPVMAHLG